MSNKEEFNFNMALWSKDLSTTIDVPKQKTPTEPITKPSSDELDITDHKWTSTSVICNGTSCNWEGTKEYIEFEINENYSRNETYYFCFSKEDAIAIAKHFGII